MTEEFMKEAIAKLISRGAATEEMFSPSTVSDEDIAQFEQQFGVTMPESLKAYLQTSSFAFDRIQAPMPYDWPDAEMLRDPDFECDLMWLNLLPVPKDDPLKPLYLSMEGFRGIGEDGLNGVSVEEIKDMIPIGDWMAGAGPMVLDLRRPESEADLDDEDTWSIRWFDHEEFEWDEIYADEDGSIVGRPLFPDLRTLLEFYYCGLYDRAYEEQLDEDGEEAPDYSEYIAR